jgi:ribosomal protein S12 methylthiotransferase
VRLLPPQKSSKILKVGEFTRARIIAADGHDLVAMPI